MLLCEIVKKIILLMIPNKEKEGCYYFEIKNYLHNWKELQKYNGDVYGLNSFHSFGTENKRHN